jgi:bifunctional non-homologous end joining protein LigD
MSHLFIPPMLTSRLTEDKLLTDPRYVAEPKLDGQRAQVHVESGRTVACFSRPGRELLGYKGLGWLRDARWPVQSAILDGELFQGNGADGVERVLAARHGDGQDLALAVFDVLMLDSRDVMSEPWERRRARLESLVPGPARPHIQLMVVCDDATRLWDVWVEGRGGEGIVLKDRRSIYRPATRSTAWQKLKQRVTVEVMVTEASDRLIEWGDWAHAAMLSMTYWNPRREATITVQQAVRVPNPDEWQGRSGVATVLSWGLMPSGLLRQPLFVQWRDAG